MMYTLHPLEAGQVEGAVEVLARAFLTDPLFEFIAPDLEERRKWMPVTMREVTRFGGPDTRSRVVVSESGDVVAAMIAGSYPPPLSLQWRQQVTTLLLPTPWVPNLRYAVRVFRYLKDWEDRHSRDPHHYVYLIGVSPDHQHRGLGRRLMMSLLEEGDSEGKPIYLETATESNVRFYESMGFRIVDTCRSHPDGPMTWMMLREVGGGSSSV